MTNDIKKKKSVLGVTYKPNVDDMRDPIIELWFIGRPRQRNCSCGQACNLGDSKEKDIYEAVSDSHLMVLAVNHEEFGDIDFAKNKKSIKLPGY